MPKKRKPHSLRRKEENIEKINPVLRKWIDYSIFCQEKGAHIVAGVRTSPFHPFFFLGEPVPKNHLYSR